jgi:hypothetical protein
MYGVFVFILPGLPFLTKRDLCYFLPALKIAIFCFVAALSRRAEAALIESGFSMDSLSLSVPELGAVRLTGVAHAQSDAARAGDILRGVRGVESVDNDIRIIPIEADSRFTL